MDLGNVPKRRISRRISILPETFFSATSNNTSDSSNKSANKEHLERYVATVEDEKKKWEDYENLLKTEYAKIRRSSAKPGRESADINNYMDYLEEDEKNLLSELDGIKTECKEYLNDLNKLKKGYMLLVPELRNQRKRLKQVLHKKRDMCLKMQMNLSLQN